MWCKTPGASRRANLGMHHRIPYPGAGVKLLSYQRALSFMIHTTNLRYESQNLTGPFPHVSNVINAAPSLTFPFALILTLAFVLAFIFAIVKIAATL
jgi:hypothetical protein